VRGHLARHGGEGHVSRSLRTSFFLLLFFCFGLSTSFLDNFPFFYLPTTTGESEIRKGGTTRLCAARGSMIYLLPLFFISFFLLLSSLFLNSPFCENLPTPIRKTVRATTGARDRGGLSRCKGG
jgi:hypothetical protein